MAWILAAAVLAPGAAASVTPTASVTPAAVPAAAAPIPAVPIPGGPVPGGPAPLVGDNYPQAEPHFTQADVVRLQWNLSGVGYFNYANISGSYDTPTTRAVIFLQSDQCIGQDGIAGPITMGRLTPLVKRVQAAVGVSQDGIVGSATKAAILNWQRAHRLTADGMAGPATMSAMKIPRVLPCAPIRPTAKGQQIASLATAELNNAARNREHGGFDCNYYSTAEGVGPRNCSNGWRAEAWCADFSKWVWRHATGVRLTGLNPMAASFFGYGTNNGSFHRFSPTLGDAVTFDWNADGVIDHVGLVTVVSTSTVSVVSGNSTQPSGAVDAITRKTYDINASSIRGFTTPKLG